MEPENAAGGNLSECMSLLVCGTALTVSHYPRSGSRDQCGGGDRKSWVSPSNKNYKTRGTTRQCPGMRDMSLSQDCGNALMSSLRGNKGWTGNCHECSVHLQMEVQNILWLSAACPNFCWDSFQAECCL